MPDLLLMESKENLVDGCLCLQMVTKIAQILENVFTDFSQQGITNYLNNHLWAEENPLNV